MALTSGQQRAFDLAMDGVNLFITGSGGVGKSFLIEQIIGKLKAKGKNVLITASTGIAALAIHGVTCHRAFAIPTAEPVWENKPVIKSDSPAYSADVILIDEVSMLRLDAFEFIIKTIEKINHIRKEDEECHKKPIQIIVVGDFCQLPPVIKTPKKPDDLDIKEELSQYYGFDIGCGYAFLSPAWKRCKFTICELAEVIRQSDQELIAIENRVRFGDFSALQYFQKCVMSNDNKQSSDDDAIYLCGKNKTAANYNDTALSNLPGDKYDYSAIVDGQVSNDDKPAPQKLTLKCGAHVIMLINTSDYCNGSRATITDLHEDMITVKISETGALVDVPYYTWAVEKYVVREREGKKKIVKEQIGTYSQLPVRLGYAITLHKSQGQTLNKVIFDIGEVGSEIFTFGQFYVGISRIKSIEGLRIKGNLSNIKCLADKSVLDFYGKAPLSEEVQTQNSETVAKKKVEKALTKRSKKEKKQLPTTEVKQQPPKAIVPIQPNQQEEIKPVYSGHKQIVCPVNLIKVVWSYASIKDPSAKLEGDIIYIALAQAGSVQSFVDNLTSKLNL